MIDKTSEEWKKIPMWAKLLLYSARSRPQAIRIELVISVLAAFLLIFTASKVLGVIALILSFAYAGAIRWADNTGLWES